MSIRAAILAILDARGLRPAEVADRMSTRNRATLYRVLSGDTADPRIGTILELCHALNTGVSELLELAGLYGSGARQLRLIDVELRQAFAEIHQLDEDSKRQCLALLRGVIGWDAQRRRTDAPSRRGVARRRATPDVPS
jgi:transcriptional regulator with XRE-family HTH domain